MRRQTRVRVRGAMTPRTTSTAVVMRPSCPARPHRLGPSSSAAGKRRVRRALSRPPHFSGTRPEWGDGDQDEGCRDPASAAFLVVGLVLVAASCVLGYVIFLRGEAPFAIDIWWNELLAAWVSPFMLGLSQVHELARRWVVRRARRAAGRRGRARAAEAPWSAAFFLAAEAASAGAVQVLKHLFGRVRPEDIIVISDYGSYPSGHVANAATIATAAVVLFPRLWVRDRRRGLGVRSWRSAARICTRTG